MTKVTLAEISAHTPISIAARRVACGRPGASAMRSWVKAVITTAMARATRPQPKSAPSRRAISAGKRATAPATTATKGTPGGEDQSPGGADEGGGGLAGGAAGEEDRVDEVGKEPETGHSTS